MSIFTSIQKKINDRLPFIRRPSNQSYTEQYVKDFGSFFKYRNKNIGVGWSTYYQSMRNVWVNACIQTYIDEIINLGFTISDPTTEKVNYTRINYFEKLFNHPMGVNSNDTFSIYQTLMWRSYLGLGDAFSEVIYDNEYPNIPVGLKYIPCEYMRFYNDTDQWGFVNDNHRFEKHELIHIKDPNIYDSVWGESKIDVIAKELTLEILANNHTMGIFENGGLNPHAVIEYDKDTKLAEVNREMARLQAEAENGDAGLLILRGAKYKNIGFSNRDMDYQQLQDRTRDCILATMGVPPAKVSIIETANLGSGSGTAQDKQFKKTLKGKAKNFEDGFSKVIGRSGSKELFQYNDLDIEDKLQRAQIENIQLNNGSLTINEVRNGYGQSSVDWGDVPVHFDSYGVKNENGVTYLGEPEYYYDANDNLNNNNNDVQLDLVKKALRTEGLII